MTTLEAPVTTAAAQTEKRRMSYEEFRAWAGEDVRAEWVEGDGLAALSEMLGPDQLAEALRAGTQRKG